MKKVTKAKLVRVITIVCIALFLIYNLYLLNEKTLRGNALPMPLGFGTAIVLSGSMEPELSVDDMIFVASADVYAVGDVVVYQSGDSLVVHRITEIADGMVTTQGDANNAPDEPVELSAIKGRVTGSLAGLGRFVRMLKSPIVSFAMMALAIFLLERSFRQDKQQEKDEIEKLEEEIRILKMEEEIRRLKEQTGE